MEVDIIQQDPSVELNVEDDFICASKTRNKTKILDSDSEEETMVKTTNTELSPEDDGKIMPLTNNKINKKKLKHKAVFDDSDDDDDHNLNKTTLESTEGANKHKSLDDSDDEDLLEEVTPHNKSFPDEETAVETVIYTTNSKGSLVKEHSSVQNPSLSALCDSESENEAECNEVDTTNDPVVEPQVYKRPRKKKKGEEGPKAMTAQEAAKQRTEIRSESQRMLRESNVSLPYHKPKSYTIKEFLQKRTKLVSAAPFVANAPPSVAIKMSKDQLQKISKKMDERIKEVQAFYKSESESESDEETKDDPSEDIRGWLHLLVENAADIVETKHRDLALNEEVISVGMEDTSMEQTSVEDESKFDNVNDDTAKKNRISELLKEKLNIQPKLSGAPDDVIDLEEGVTRVSEVKKLVEKFFQHTAKRIPHKHKVQLNVVGVNSGGQVTTETISMNVDEEEEPAVLETPGAKLKKLKEDLQEQMAQRRLEQWKQKHEQGDCLLIEKKVEDEKCQQEKDILDDEDEEYELTESESEEEDEDDYIEHPEKPKVKSAFVDEEAELEDEPDDDDEAGSGDDPEDQSEDSAASETDVKEAPEEQASPKKKVLRRILKAFSSDSDDENEQSVLESNKITKFSTNDEDDFIPPNLPKEGKSQQPTQEENASELEFLTPVTYLTGLQNLNSDLKSHDTPRSPLLSLSNPLASQEEDTRSEVEKNLFLESSQDSQANIEDLAQLCSGTFPITQNTVSRQKCLENEVSGDLPSTQDLLNLCSGEFSTLPATNAKSSENGKVDKPIVYGQLDPDKEIKSLDDEQDQIISQLLDEDELERFKKRFESPLKASASQSQEVEEVNATGLINSDDENDELELKQRKRKKLCFSDDEEEDADGDVDESEEEEREEEEIDLHATDDEEQQLENEIVAQESYNYKLTDFLDKEAELSESEWGSDDEDEKDLDQLEFEKGDEEKFNENKIRTEIERIHMRQLLDDDNREVKLLQELLLEDGELNGSGRKRQFRWKALDSENNSGFEQPQDDDIFLDEDENEEEWRKMRHKRAMFLKKKSATVEDDIIADSQILKIGQQIFKQKTFSSQSSTPTNKDEDEEKKPSILSSKRGSFLSRNDQVLQRLAEYNKVTTTVGTTTKNSRGFVFQTVEVKETVVKDNNNKRKASEATPKILKKMRLDNISPAVGKNNPKKNNRVKKLFANW